jgi:hypothetical protein
VRLLSGFKKCIPYRRSLGTSTNVLRGQDQASEGEKICTSDQVHERHDEEVPDARCEAYVDTHGEYDYFGRGRGRRTSGPARVPEHDRLPPLPDGDEARHTVQCVSVCSFSGFDEDITSTGHQEDLQVPTV